MSVHVKPHRRLGHSTPKTLNCTADENGNDEEDEAGDLSVVGDKKDA